MWRISKALSWTPWIVLVATLGALAGAPLHAQPWDEAASNVTSDTSPGVAPSGIALERTVARELARLDDRLDLGTFPDGTGMWSSRLAAALEYRVEHGESAGVVSPHLTARLAHALRRLGIERNLEPGLGGRDGAGASESLSSERIETLRYVLESVRRLHDKLDRRGAPLAERGTLTPRAAPVNDDCVAASVIGDGLVTGSIVEATVDGSASCGSSDTTPDVWYRYTASGAGTVTFEAYDADFYQLFDPVLSLHTGCPGDSGVTEVACNDDTNGGFVSQITLEMLTGDEVWIRVSGFDGSLGTFNLRVEREGAISGTVTDGEAGTAIGGATVTLFGGRERLDLQTTTASDGTYSFGALPHGIYKVSAAKDGYLTGVVEGVQVSGGEVSGIDLALSPAATLSGRLTDAVDDSGVAGFLTLYDETHSYLDSIQTAPDGSFTFQDLPAGTYLVEADAEGYQAEIYDDIPCPTAWCDIDLATPIEVTIGETVSGVDFDLERLGAIEGTVIEAGTDDPVVGLAVRARGGPEEIEGLAYTDADGAYRIENLSAGPHRVWTQSGGHANEVYDDIPCGWGCDTAPSTLVTVALNATTSGIDFDLEHEGTLAGRVTESSSGTPLEGLLIQVFDAEGRFFDNQSTSPDGRYQFALAPGTYFVMTDPTTYHGYIDEVWDSVHCELHACDPLSGTPVDVLADQTTGGIDFPLDHWGRIEGAVRGADTAGGLSGNAVALDEQGAVVASAPVNGETYGIRGLQSGTYYVKFFYDEWSVGDYQDELYDDIPCEPSCDLGLGTPFTVGFNQKITSVDFVLAPCPADTANDVSGTEYLAAQTEQACERITAGAGTTVSTGADVTFKAGRSIAIGDGFRVESGASFRAVIEPAWSAD